MQFSPNSLISILEYGSLVVSSKSTLLLYLRDFWVLMGAVDDKIDDVICFFLDKHKIWLKIVFAVYNFDLFIVLYAG